MGSSDNRPCAEAVIVERIIVKSGRLVLDVRVGEGFPVDTDPDIAAAALRIRPTLAHHACVNSSGPTFRSVIDRTSLPHLFEHLIVDEQVRMAKAANTAEHPSRSVRCAGEKSGCLAPGTAFKGSTKWIDRSRRLACVQVSFEDDIFALEAVTRATALMRRIFL